MDYTTACLALRVALAYALRIECCSDWEWLVRRNNNSLRTGFATTHGDLNNVNQAPKNLKHTHVSMVYCTSKTNALESRNQLDGRRGVLIEDALPGPAPMSEKVRFCFRWMEVWLA